MPLCREMRLVNEAQVTEHALTTPGGGGGGRGPLKGQGNPTGCWVHSPYPTCTTFLPTLDQPLGKPNLPQQWTWHPVGPQSLEGRKVNGR